MKECTCACCTAGRTHADFSNLSSFLAAQKHFIACFLHLSLTRTLKAVAIRRVLPPSLNEQVITSLSLRSPCPGGLSENLPPTCLQLCICFSLRFASLPFNLFSLSLLVWTLSLSPSSLQPLYFAPPISKLWAALGFRWITLTMLDQYWYWSTGKMFIKSF